MMTDDNPEGPIKFDFNQVPDDIVAITYDGSELILWKTVPVLKSEQEGCGDDAYVHNYWYAPNDDGYTVDDPESHYRVLDIPRGLNPNKSLTLRPGVEDKDVEITRLKGLLETAAERLRHTARELSGLAIHGEYCADLAIEIDEAINR